MKPKKPTWQLVNTESFLDYVTINKIFDRIRSIEKIVMEEKPTRRGLKTLLNSLEDVHKKDIHDFSGGFLNESRLYKLPREMTSAAWVAAKKSPPPLNKPCPSLASDRKSTKEHKMTDTLKMFSLGTSGAVAPVVVRSRRAGTKGPVIVERNPSAVSSQGSYSARDDGVLVENVGKLETMVKAKNTDCPVTWDQYDLRDSHEGNKFSQSFLKDKNLGDLKHKFLPSHMNAATKKDQYKRLMNFESDILQKYDTLEQNVMSGAKAVEHLEAKLREDLDNLNFNSYGPNFHRLQIYSNTFEDLIDDSPTFKYILGTIKKEYDDYISSLLDQQPSRHQLLYNQVEQLSGRGTSNPLVLADEQRRLDRLQQLAVSSISENEKLRAELQEERLLSEDAPVEEEEDEGNAGLTEPDLDLADKIEEAHAIILEKLDQIRELRSTLRKEYVPSSVVTHLEQCIKETEVESQRYQSQKEFFDRSCQEMEKDLKDAIENADTTEKDAKRIWKKVLQRDGENESMDGEEEAKWNWYIS